MRFELEIHPGEPLEKRAWTILDYLIRQQLVDSVEVKRIEATGTLGNFLTQRLNRVDAHEISCTQVLKLFSEDGHVIAGGFQLLLKNEEQGFIGIADGRLVVETKADIPPAVHGEVRTLPDLATIYKEHEYLWTTNKHEYVLWQDADGSLIYNIKDGTVLLIEDDEVARVVQSIMLANGCRVITSEEELDDLESRGLSDLSGQ